MGNAAPNTLKRKAGSDLSHVHANNNNNKKKSVGVFTGKAGVLELIFISYDTSCFEPLECEFEAKLLFEHTQTHLRS